MIFFNKLFIIAVNCTISKSWVAPAFQTADVLQMEEIELSNINISVTWAE